MGVALSNCAVFLKFISMGMVELFYEAVSSRLLLLTSPNKTTTFSGINPSGINRIRIFEAQ